MLVADDDFVRNRLLAHGELLAAMPFLNQYRAQLLQLDQACATCSGAAEAKKQRSDLFNNIRTTLAGLSPTQWQQIKTVLGCGPSCPVLVAYRVRVQNQNKLESRTC